MRLRSTSLYFSRHHFSLDLKEKSANFRKIFFWIPFPDSFRRGLERVLAASGGLLVKLVKCSVGCLYGDFRREAGRVSAETLDSRL